NGFQDTKEAVYSLLGQTEKLYKIIIVDNCSPDNSYADLVKEYDKTEEVIVLKSEKNAGFSYGNNFGMKYALENFDFDFFMLINNDTISDKKVNKEFIDYYSDKFNDKLGILTGKIYYYYDKNLIWSAGGYVNRTRALGKHFGMDEMDLGQYDGEKEIDFATGCLWFFHKSLVSEIGFMPEEYFMYFEDVDYCLNLKNKGGKIIYLSQVKIWHKVGASSDIGGKIPNYKIMNRNRFILAKKYLTTKEKINFITFMYIRCVIWFFIHLVRDKKIVNTIIGLK
ncbi:MAG: glycosyltransferase family 2 protein, partial [Fusobacteriaceae bacterium]|nr:glycosyltransferase family 2 protein [Fusobacteriaceae bacterium]